MDSTLKSARPVPAASSSTPTVSPPRPGPGLSLDDIYYTLFRHNRKIILCTVTGLLAAGVVMLYVAPTYQSEAKLFIRYVVSENPSQGVGNDELVTKSPDMRGETIIASEEQILTSFDSARQVAQVIGPERLLASSGGGSDLTLAAVVVSRGLTADAAKYSSVIDVSFRHSDPSLVQPVLNEVISQYLKRHVEIHRAAGLVGDFLAQETDQLRARLSQTESELRKAKAKGQVVSLDDTRKNFSAEIAAIRQQIFATEADLAEREAIVTQFTDARAKDVPEAKTDTEALRSDESPLPVRDRVIPSSVRDEYRTVSERLEALRAREQQLLVPFTPENTLVKEVRAQIAQARATKAQLETTYPHLADEVLPARPDATDDPSRRVTTFLATENVHIAALRAKIKSLNSNLDAVRASAAALEGVEGTIEELTRKKELEESNYRRYAASLEQSRINEALGSGKVSNISVIQTPSPPLRDDGKLRKIVAGIAVSGLMLGLAWAFAIELVLDRTVRRRSDVEKKLGLPLFLSVPVVTAPGSRRRFWQRTPRRPTLEPPPSEPRPPNGHPVNGTTLATLTSSEATLHPFHETLRDRLTGYFERRGLTHRPKLVTVTGISQNVGVTTTAAGLASCLSQTGEGNVLLVDLTSEQRSAQQFYHGKTVPEIDDVLALHSNGEPKDKLYIVSDNRGADALSRVLPQRFRSLVPRLKASDFDYIIFDMPPVSQISITPRLAGYMDMVLLVVESEKNSLDVVQRAATLLNESTSHVGVVLNKTRTYVPQMILQEDLGN